MDRHLLYQLKFITIEIEQYIYLTGIVEIKEKELQILNPQFTDPESIGEDFDNLFRKSTVYFFFYHIIN